MEMKTTLGQLINSEVLSDHFDHYGAPSVVGWPHYDNNQNHLKNPISANKDYANDAPLPEDEFVEALSDFPEPEPPNSSKKMTVTQKQASQLSRDDTYLCSIENDVRKRIIRDSEVTTRTQDDIALTSQAKNQQSRQKTVSKAISKEMGSLPDISLLKNLEAMDKEDLLKLSAARKEEIRKLLEEQERRNAGDISVLAGDVKVYFANIYIPSSYLCRIIPLETFQKVKADLQMQWLLTSYHIILHQFSLLDLIPPIYIYCNNVEILYIILYYVNPCYLLLKLAC